MRYLVLLRAKNPDSAPPAELMAGIGELGEEAMKSGALIDTAGLAPSATGAKATVIGGELSVTDGPFAETKELISYAIYEVGSKEEAIEWTSRFMKLHRDTWPGWEGDAEIVQVFDPAAMGAPDAS